MLDIQNLHVKVDGKNILNGLDLHINEGETHALFGQNGSGKTTLVLTIMGFPRYRVTKGRILFKKEDITHLPINERARLGIGLSFQHPPAIHGVKLKDLVETTAKHGNQGFNTTEVAKTIHIPSDFLTRDVNLGFSGGEVKRTELLQLLAQNPDLVLLDEPDSGVDLENIELVGETINKLLERDKRSRERHKAGLIITHAGGILKIVKADKAHVLVDGQIACSGNPGELLHDICELGYEECVRCPR
ncbi:MAG TPA: Fe-S cluster assembly ATPase SufC [Candidatus Bathyarchaeia archaeon]|nr:Fe-S cluster assembly ATPase SufC [Candidatus Bathyarchaeia archaeon]